MTRRIGNNVIEIDTWKLITIICTIITSTWGAHVWYTSWVDERERRVQETHATYVLVKQLAAHDSINNIHNHRVDSSFTAQNKFNDSVRRGYYIKEYQGGYVTERKDRYGRVHTEAANSN